MEIPGPKTGITDLLDEAQRKQGNDNDAEYAKKSPLRPSAAGYCARRLCYAVGEYRGYWNYNKASREPNITRLLRLGHFVEDHSIENLKLIKDVEVLYTQQILDFFEINGELITGANDMVLYHPEWKALGDVKSKKDNWSGWYKNQWAEELERLTDMDSVVQISPTSFYLDDPQEFIKEVGDDFLTDNIVQLNMYAFSDFFQKVSRQLDFLFLYRYNKNDSRHMEIRWKPSLHLYEYVKQKFKDVSEAADKKDPTLVEREWWLGSMRCAFCPYKEPCWGGEDALKEYFNTLPKKHWPTDVAQGTKLAGLFESIEQGETTLEAKARVENEAITLMTEHDLKRIKLPNGHVYFLKYIKSAKPRARLELRRGKL